MITFHVLGTVEVRAAGGQHAGSPLLGSKRLALLAYLALASRRGRHRRDTLLGLFWPELDEKHARNSLSNMLYHLRHALGGRVIEGWGNDEVALAEGAVWCDATEFQRALDAGRPEEALELYRGDLLEGFFPRGVSSDFDHWLDGERARLRRAATAAIASLIQSAEAAGNAREAVRWARRAHHVDPYDEPAVRRLILSLEGSGDRSAALRIYEDFAARLAREFETEPSPETRAVIERFRGRAETGESPGGGSAGPAAPESMTPARRGAVQATGAPDAPGTPLSRSLAILPFENLSGSAEAEPLVAGLHDDVITELSKISALTVVSRSSVARYRGTNRPMREIARELGVGTLLEGSVQTAAGRLRLNVQLIDGTSDAHLWAERYDRELSMDGIFDIQTELAERIAVALRARLTPAERERMGRGPTHDLEAYRLYTQGRGLLDQRTETGIRRSLDYFERATEQDPHYALAWVGIADALALLHDYGYGDAAFVFPRADAAARRALELEPDLAEAHASMGAVHGIRRRRFEVTKHLRRAVELRPGYAEAHNWLSWNYQVIGDAWEALESARRAVELDPLSPEAVSNLSLSSLANGDAKTALREARRTRELQPDWTTGRFYEGLALYHLDRYAEAAASLEGLAVEWAGSGPEVTLGLAHAAMGERTRADRLRKELEASGDVYAAGLILLAQDERDQAFDAFRRVERWDYWPVLSLHHFYPRVLAPLRADDLYPAMLRKMERSWWQER